ncbi:MAG TPA: UDP binding domain-containing protein [Solirubrobacteraceae bacterium]|jgi:UDP-N-acetyl-D-mannosaminuronic acid dehydrogenase|nr:UDP binding domain-containing protein [Solirubrobacteraceae bacterium]
MAAPEHTADVSVIGLGRVGLPLALSFADRGLRVIGIDNDPVRLDSLRGGTMPFQEPGAQELLERLGAGPGRLRLSDRVADAAGARHIVITLGTPSFSHIEIDMRHIRSALDDLLGVLAPGHSLVLRSTVAPGTTEFVAGYLEKHRGFRVGEDLFVAHVPERIAAGRFLAEIDSLPCIVGGVGARSGEATGVTRSGMTGFREAAGVTRSGEVAAELFGVFSAPIVHTTPVQAELAKIWANILRYTNFALPNLLMMDCERHAANVFEVIDLINRDYPRGGIAQPGLTAGTCLRKDFAFSEERSNAPGMLLAVSRVNESVPLFLVEGMRRRMGTIANRKVAVLGLAFKADTDDERDSLAHKLIRLLERELADVAVHDPHVATPTAPLQEALQGADAVVVAANHSEFRNPATLAAIGALAVAECLVIDPWNCWGAGQVFAYASELAALAPTQ